MKSVRDGLFNWLLDRLEDFEGFDSNLPFDLEVPDLTVGLVANNRTRRRRKTPRTTPTVWQSVSKWARRPKNRARLLLGFWMLAVAFLFLGTALGFWICHRSTGTFKWAMLIGAPVWGFALAGFVLFAAPSKVITSICGGLVGVGADQILANDGLIAKAARAVTTVATQMGLIAGTTQPTDPFIVKLVWLFLLVFFVTALPAFMRGD